MIGVHPPWVVGLIWILLERDDRNIEVAENCEHRIRVLWIRNQGSIKLGVPQPGRVLHIRQQQDVVFAGKCSPRDLSSQPHVEAQTDQLVISRAIPNRWPRSPTSPSVLDEAHVHYDSESTRARQLQP